VAVVSGIAMSSTALILSCWLDLWTSAFSTLVCLCPPHVAIVNSSPKIVAALGAMIPSEIYVIFSGIGLPPALFWVCFCLSTGVFFDVGGFDWN
jgi:hypothetical protein